MVFGSARHRAGQRSPGAIYDDFTQLLLPVNAAPPIRGAYSRSPQRFRTIHVGRSFQQMAFHPSEVGFVHNSGRQGPVLHSVKSAQPRHDSVPAGPGPFRRHRESLETRLHQVR